ncbi:MAG: pilus assembly protein N-terminal domain-containing protein [Marinobacter sp.]|uniref:type II and III secretion system protein family protein n=1 Tax=Marinobacter sp. TaxID=50741 RepID=UPI00299E633C|nr:pilus assembly protein N-terminal domain-containing protein [Marinobacter sp.]MDX1755301.1 pilus assembly protein N-terminal domain-containing protein [Marinobacter sp.]
MFANGVTRAWLLGVLVAWACSVQAINDGAPVTLGSGEQRVLNFPNPLTKVATANPEIAAVSVSGDREIIVTGVGEGATILSVWQRGEREPLQAPVLVAPTLAATMPFGTQVQTDIRIVEVNRSKLNSLGLYYSRLFDGGKSAIGIAPPGTGFRGFGSAAGGAPISAEGFNLFSFGAHSLAIVNALESGGFAYTLAEPSLTSLSGQSATFLSGGEFPIPVGVDDNSIEIEFKEFGIRLNLTPTVIDQNQIILKVAPEVSELDFSSGVQTGGVAVPGLRVRRTETTVSMGPGETFIISGLVSRNTINNSDRIPGLGNIPVLGALFRSDRISREDKELIMVVTPHIVTPVAADQQKPASIGVDYQNSSVDWLDMATGSSSGSEPVKHGLSW